MPEADHNKIEDIKRHLYDPQDTTTHRAHDGVLHRVDHDIAKSWKPEKEPENEALIHVMEKPPTSVFKKFFIGSIAFFVCAIAFAMYMFFGNNISVSGDNIDIAVLGNAFTKGGEDLPLQIEITNHNNASLELANLIISYPRGASDDPTDVVRLPRDSIGTLLPGARVTRNIKVNLFGDEKSTRDIKISLEYHAPGSNAIFTKDKDYNVVISSAPLSLLIDAPSQATSDQDVSFSVTATLNTSLPDNATVIQVTYPNSFIFESAVPAPTVGNSIWPLQSLSAGNSETITIKGRLVGQDGDQQVFHVYAGATTPTDQSKVSVVYNSLLQTVTIAKPFLSARILVNNQDLSNYAISGGQLAHAEINWVNNLPSRVTDAKIIANLSGNAFDKNSVDSIDGFYDSANSQIIWDKNSTPGLASVEPGASGTLGFTFRPLSLLGSKVSINSPEIDIDVSIRGQQPAVGSTFNDINNFSKKVIKIISDFQIASSANFTSGPLPPKAENETKYTVTWTLSNSANGISGATARSVLPIYINWVGVANGSNENVSYNSVTREVFWNIGAVSPNTGFNSNRETSFVLSLKPSISQVDSIPQLMKDVSLSGTDIFTGTTVNSSSRPITTTLNNDPAFKPGDDRVIK
ncbi:MAG: hypothetical protein WCK91_01615 [bacterium]